MLYLADATAPMVRVNAIDKGEGPGPFFGQRVERFHPHALYGDPTQRHDFMVVDLDTTAKMAEQMYAFTWWAGKQPKFTPIIALEVYGEAITNAKKLAAAAVSCPPALARPSRRLRAIVHHAPSPVRPGRSVAAAGATDLAAVPRLPPAAPGKRPGWPSRTRPLAFPFP